MQSIKWELDGGLDLEDDDPLGSIAVFGNEGSIVDECVFVDRYLTCLVEGFTAIGEGKEVVIELFDEPWDLKFSIEGRGFRISYGSQSVMIASQEAFGRNLVSAVSELLALVDESEIVIYRPLPAIEFLREYLKRESLT